MRSLVLAGSLMVAFGGLGCGDSGDASHTDAGGGVVQGTCVRQDSEASFCLAFSDLPAGNVDAARLACEQTWEGNWTIGTQCEAGTLIGTCRLYAGPSAGAALAVIEVYQPTDPLLAEEDICGNHGTWEAL